MILLFVFYPNFLTKFGNLFGVARGADVIVYGSLIILFWLYFWAYNKILRQDIGQTDLLREIVIHESLGGIENNIKTVIIMPTYKQKEKVLHLIQQLRDLGYGVIMVDDGLNGDLSDKIIEKFPQNVVVIKHPFNLWQGAALQTGQQYALRMLPSVQYIVHFDSDWQHQAKDIASFEKKFLENTNLDIVLGSRFLPWAGKIPKKRAFHKKLQIFFMRVIVGIKLTDTNNGFRMVARKTLPKLKLTMNDYTHASEIESLIKSQHLQYAEVPVDIIYDEEHIKNGQKLGNAFNIAKSIIYKQFFFK